MTNSNANERIDKVVREGLKNMGSGSVSPDWSTMEKVLENQPNRYKVSYMDVSPYLLVGVLGTIITGVLLFFILRKSDNSATGINQEKVISTSLETLSEEKTNTLAPVTETKKIVVTNDSMQSIRKSDSLRVILSKKLLVDESSKRISESNNEIKETEKNTNDEKDSSKSKISRKNKRRSSDSLRPTAESINVDETLEIPSSSIPDSTAR